MTEAEWHTRVDLAACYRLIAHYGMSDLVYNHATARIPGTDHFLINAYGLLYHEITASSLVTIDLNGDVVRQGTTKLDVNRAGYVIHSAIHSARHDVDCVIHTHTRAGMAVSSMACGLLPLTQSAMRFRDIAYHEYEGPAVDLAEQERLVRDLGCANAMILRNHGLLVAGASVAQAFNALYWLEMACRAQVDAMASRTELTIPSPEVVQKTWHLYQPEVRRPFGEMEWPAMLRLAEQLDSSFKD
jgi:ribulose-5-phosphate 4-epimerase/fuculose-1-phosphate aldolase